jgi:Styrene monooxygenase A putative substrate binding domain
MARKILIVGAGQSGLQLALGLQRYGYDVTVITARTPAEIRGGRVMSTQAMFSSALQHERDLGLNFWEQQAPPIEGMQVTVSGPDRGRALNWLGHLDKPGRSVDQRIKMPGWLDTFRDRGGKVVIHGATLSDLDALAPMYDLTVIAAGKGELVNLFQRDAERSTFTEPQRALAVVYVRGLTPRPEFPGIEVVHFNLIPGVGELFVMPALTTTGPCHILFFEGIPGGELDCFSGVSTGEEHLKLTLQLMEKFTPWEHERARSVELTDRGGYLSGRYAPVVRKPVGRLPRGGIVLGMADVVVANDPITGQGSNNASHCAAIYQQAILDHGRRPFDEEFMRYAFDAYWDDVRWVTAWTDALLRPPPPHVLELLGAAQDSEEIRHRFANGFNNPRDFFDWFMDPGRAAAYLAEVRAGADRGHPGGDQAEYPSRRRGGRSMW